MSRSKKQVFSRVLWGYKPAQVISEMESMADSHESKLLNYHQQIEKMQAELACLLEQETACQDMLARCQKRENLLADALLTAQAEANEIIAEARREADNLINEAREEIERQRSLLQAVQQQQEQFLDGFGSLYQRLQNNCWSLLKTQVDDSDASLPLTSESAASFPDYQEYSPEGGEAN